MSIEKFEPDYPMEQELQAREESRGSKFEVDHRLFRPRPFKDREKFDNKLFFLLFRFSDFTWFSKCPLSNYSLKLYLHSINEINDAGQAQQRYVICEPSMNKHVTEQWSSPTRVVSPPFPGERACPFCRKSQDFWDKYREMKKDAGIDGVTPERFKVLMDQHPEIREVRELAKQWGAQEKYYFLLFDYSKWLGEIEVQEGEEEMGIQAYIGPVKLADGLYKKQKNGLRFWDFTNGDARAIVYTRDNKNGKRFCTYEIDNENAQPQLDGETLAYLQNPPAAHLFDPSVFIRKLTLVEKQNYVRAYGEGSPTPRNDDGGGNVDEPTEAAAAEPEKPAAEVPVARPRARVAAPASPPPAAAAAPAELAPPPARTVQAAPPPPSAEADATPKRAKVTWRK